jgi:hypothetical protein
MNDRVKEMQERLRSGTVHRPTQLEAADMLGELQDRIAALEAKCALLAASWKKAEEEKIRAAQPKTSR